MTPWLPLLLLLFVAPACRPAQTGPGLDLPRLYTLTAAKAVRRPAEDAPSVVYDVNIYPEVLTPGRDLVLSFEVEDQTLALNLVQVPARQMPLPEGQYAWTAKVPGGGQALFMLIEGWADAHVPYGGAIYRVRPLASKKGLLEVYAVDRFGASLADATGGSHSDELAAVDSTIGTLREEAATAIDASCHDATHRYDVMVLYTPQAACHAALPANADSEACKGPFTSESAAELNVYPVEHDIHKAMAHAKLAHLNSEITTGGVLVQPNLVYTGMAHYNEPAQGGVGLGTALGDMSDTSPDDLDAYFGTTEGGLAGDVGVLAEATRADVVSLLVETPLQAGYCGLGEVRQRAALTDCSQYGGAPCRNKSVVVRSGGCLTSHKLAHEVAHNLGAMHDRADFGGDPATATAFPGNGFNFGHIHPHTPEGKEPWVTVTSDADSCKQANPPADCKIVPWFSNPDVTYPGDGSAIDEATGVAYDPTDPNNLAEDNALAIELNAGVVSQNRCEFTKYKPDVWMKDFWGDDGTEGEPFAGFPVWRSPYIWVRTAPDTAVPADGPQGPYSTFIHEHVHQNPVFAEESALKQDNYVYVKLHNTGQLADANEKLEVYYAKASTGLNNPSQWTLIDEVEHTMQPGTVDVVEVRWDKNEIPGKGKYCLLARWNSDEGPLSFDGNLASAVRADNDLIWRNVNIVDLGVFADAVLEPGGGTGELVDGGTGGSESSEGCPAPTVTESVIVPGDRGFPDTFLLVTATPISSKSVDWGSIIRQVGVEVKSGISSQRSFKFPDLTPAPTECPDHQGTFTFPVGKQPQVRRMGPFRLRAGTEAEVKLKFWIDPLAAKEISKEQSNPLYFDVTIMQVGAQAWDDLNAQGARAAPSLSPVFQSDLVLGGVSYMLRLPAGAQP